MLTWDETSFRLHGEEFHIYSGAMHYFRILPQYWEDRLQKLKAAGFNTVETYVCWNLHEPRKGQFDFSGRLDLVQFLETARKVGLYALVRPGPYICAEWDFGGLPAWLLQDKGLRLRCSDPQFLDHVADYFRVLLPKLLPLQSSRGGNLLAVQVENEYGSYGNDKTYLRWLRDLIRSCGVEVPLFTSDGPVPSMLSGGTVEGVLPTVNFGSGADKAFRALKQAPGGGPKMCTEFWCGWFDHWGEKHHTRDSEEMLRELSLLLEQDASFSLYMFHGGTNFGFTAGANQHIRYNPTVTSYDYDAPLNEYGDYTPKYFAIRELLCRHQGIPLPPLPPRPQLQELGEVPLVEWAELRENLEVLGTVHRSPLPESMEHYGQNFGLIDYRTCLPGDYEGGTLTLEGLGDRAYVYRDGILLGVLDQGKPRGLMEQLRPRNALPFPPSPAGTQVEILVEAMGRVNYGSHLENRKGLTNVRLGGQSLMDFTVTTLPLEHLEGIRYCEEASRYPLVLRGYFDADSQKDCFVALDGFTKGMVYVNGFHLGRYWSCGPQRTLYLPGVLLHTDRRNEVVVLELEDCARPVVRITDTHCLG